MTGPYCWGTTVADGRVAGGTVSPIPDHDEHLLDDQCCACGAPIMFRRRVVMGQRGGVMMFAAWCQANPEHVLPEPMLREIAELRFAFGTDTAGDSAV